MKGSTRNLRPAHLQGKGKKQREQIVTQITVLVYLTVCRRPNTRQGTGLCRLHFMQSLQQDNWQDSLSLAYSSKAVVLKHFLACHLQARIACGEQPDRCSVGGMTIRLSGILLL